MQINIFLLTGVVPIFDYEDAIPKHVVEKYIRSLIRNNLSQNTQEEVANLEISCDINLNIENNSFMVAFDVYTSERPIQCKIIDNIVNADIIPDHPSWKDVNEKERFGQLEYY